MTQSHSLKLLFLFSITLFLPQGTHAYDQKDVTRVAAPGDGGIVLLRGYNSRFGTLKEHCLVPVGKTERGIGQPLSSSYHFVRSMEEVIRDRSLDVSTKLDVSFGIGGASVGVAANFYKKNQSHIEQGAAHAIFYDSESPVFAASGVDYKLTNEAQDLFQKSIKKGQLGQFSKKCGDAVIIGKQRARFFEGIAFFSDKRSGSEEQREVDIKIAARYMAVKLGVGVSMSKSDKERAREMNVMVDYIASGDPILPGGKNMKGFREAFSAFQGLTKDQTFDVVNVGN